MSSLDNSPMTSPAPYRSSFGHPTPSAAPSTSYLEPPSSSSRPLLQARSSLSSATGPVYHRHPGCVLCSLITAAEDSPDSPRPSDVSTPPMLGDDDRSPSPSRDAFLAKGKSKLVPGRSQSPFDPYAPSSPIGDRVIVLDKQVVYQDQELLVYLAEGKERLCNDGRHLVIVPKQHWAGVYELGPPDVPLLSHMLEIATRLLPLYGSDRERKAEEARVGFVSTIRDPSSPYPHLHAHATIGPMDAASFFRRNVVYSPLNWWSIQDLRAEIREESSNNRVKSGYPDRIGAPIDTVPDAGARTGLPNALNLVESGEPPDDQLTTGFNVVPPTPEVQPPMSPSEGRRRGKGVEV